MQVLIHLTREGSTGSYFILCVTRTKFPKTPFFKKKAKVTTTKKPPNPASKVHFFWLSSKQIGVGVNTQKSC